MVIGYASNRWWSSCGIQNTGTDHHHPRTFHIIYHSHIGFGIKPVNSGIRLHRTFVVIADDVLEINNENQDNVSNLFLI